jgi:hypothetical protein
MTYDNKYTCIIHNNGYIVDDTYAIAYTAKTRKLQDIQNFVPGV